MVSLPLVVSSFKAEGRALLWGGLNWAGEGQSRGGNSSGLHHHIYPILCVGLHGLTRVQDKCSLFSEEPPTADAASTRWSHNYFGTVAPMGVGSYHRIGLSLTNQLLLDKDPAKVKQVVFQLH